MRQADAWKAWKTVVVCESVMPKYTAMLNKVMLSTESRMPWGQYKYGLEGRYGKTTAEEAVRRSVPSLRLEKRRHHWTGCTPVCHRTMYLLERIAEQTPLHVHLVSFSLWQTGLFRSELPTAGDSTAIVSCPAGPIYKVEGINLELTNREMVKPVTPTTASVTLPSHS